MVDSPPATRVEAHHEVLRALTPDVERLLGVLPPVSRAWQPSDLLPDFSSEAWPERLRQLREQARRIPDELLVALVGDMVTGDQMDPKDVADKMVELVEADSTQENNFIPPEIEELVKG